MAEPRSNQRAQETDLTRIRMAERDLDIHDALIEAIDGKFNRIMWMLVMVMASLMTSIILFAANLLVK